MTSTTPTFVSSFTPRPLSSTNHSTLPVSKTTPRPSRVSTPLLTAAPPSRSEVTKTTTTISRPHFSLPWMRKPTVPVTLPQNTAPHHRTARQEDVLKARKEFVWDNTIIKNVSTMSKIPCGEFPPLAWFDKIIPIAIRTAVNTAINAAEDVHEAIETNIISKFSRILAPLFGHMATGTMNERNVQEAVSQLADIAGGYKQGAGTSLDEYKELFESIPLDTVGKNDQFLRDDIFGWYRVAGPNPMKLEACTGLHHLFPEMTNKILRGIEGFEYDSLWSMRLEKRLYIVDYPEFNGMSTGTIDGKKKNSYMYAPICLLGVPRQPSDRQALLPLAIRPGQDRRIHTLHTANPDHTDPNTWLAAKVTVQVADGLSHEAIYHLAYTHLLAGIAVCATYRSLPEAHPLNRLLRCHFDGTAFINHMAATALVVPGGPIDTLTAPDIAATMDLVRDALHGENSNFNSLFPDDDLVHRDVMSERLHFPYRDDALQLWDALLQWVTSYVDAYYSCDADVRNDTELQAWCAEMTDKDKGNLRGFGNSGNGRIRTKKYLARAIALIIFTATVQHAAMNFPQCTMMQYAPAMPLAGYAPPPASASERADAFARHDNPNVVSYDSVSDVVKHMLPPLDKAAAQLAVAEFIGVLKYGDFGEYGRELDFAPEGVREAMEELQEKLGYIGGRIQERNVKERNAGLPTYKYLVPKNIPQSINI